MSVEIAKELEIQAAYYASRATEEYPEPNRRGIPHARRIGPAPSVHVRYR